jgi:MFS family permease
LDFPAKTIALVLLVKAGRRWPYIICVTIAGLAFLSMMAFQRGYYTNDWPIVVCAMIGNLCISTTFAIIWLYTPELFPTSIRYHCISSRYSARYTLFSFYISFAVEMLASDLVP